MPTQRIDTASSTQSEFTIYPDATCESKDADSNTVEQVDDEDSETHDHTAAQSGFIFVGGGGATTDIARRVGTDRHAEAGYAERAHAKAYAKKTGGAVVEDGTSAYAPDGGIDTVIETELKDKYIQSKHYGQKVSESTLEKYADSVDAIGATNGVTPSEIPEAYNIDIITSNDWYYRDRATLELKRIIRGYRKGAAGLVNGTRLAATHLVDSTRLGGRLVYMGAESVRRKSVKIASTVAVRVAKRSVLKKAVLSVATLIIAYILWRWYTNKKETEDNYN